VNNLIEAFQNEIGKIIEMEELKTKLMEY